MYRLDYFFYYWLLLRLFLSLDVKSIHASHIFHHLFLYFCICKFVNWLVLNLTVWHVYHLNKSIVCFNYYKIAVEFIYFGIFKYKKIKINNVLKWNNLRSRAIFKQKNPILFFKLSTHQDIKRVLPFDLSFYIIKFYFSNHFLRRDILLRP